MAICKYCEQDMSADGTVTCSENLAVLYPDDQLLSSVPHASVNGERCPGCNVAVGGYHHIGCNQEICPRCGGRLLSCSCL